MVITLILSIVIVIGASQYLLHASPRDCTSNSWILCTNANANGGGSSAVFVSSTAPKTAKWWKNSFKDGNGNSVTIPDDAIITSVKLTYDHFETGDAWIRAFMTVGSEPWAVAGPSFHCDPGECRSIVDVTNILPWEPYDFNSGYIWTNLSCKKTAGGTNGYCYADWIQLNVTWTQI